MSSPVGRRGRESDQVPLKPGKRRGGTEGDLQGRSVCEPAAKKTKTALSSLKRRASEQEPSLEESINTIDQIKEKLLKNEASDHDLQELNDYIKNSLRPTKKSTNDPLCERCNDILEHLFLLPNGNELDEVQNELAKTCLLHTEKEKAIQSLKKFLKKEEKTPVKEPLLSQEILAQANQMLWQEEGKKTKPGTQALIAFFTKKIHDSKSLSDLNLIEQTLYLLPYFDTGKFALSPLYEEKFKDLSLSHLKSRFIQETKSPKLHPTQDGSTTILDQETIDFIKFLLAKEEDIETTPVYDSITEFFLEKHAANPSETDLQAIQETTRRIFELSLDELSNFQAEMPELFFEAREEVITDVALSRLYEEGPLPMEIERAPLFTREELQSHPEILLEKIHIASSISDLEYILSSLKDIDVRDEINTITNTLLTTVLSPEDTERLKSSRNSLLECSKTILTGLSLINNKALRFAQFPEYSKCLGRDQKAYNDSIELLLTSIYTLVNKNSASISDKTELKTLLSTIWRHNEEEIAALSHIDETSPIGRARQILHNFNETMVFVEGFINNLDTKKELSLSGRDEIFNIVEKFQPLFQTIKDDLFHLSLSDKNVVLSELYQTLNPIQERLDALKTLSQYNFTLHTKIQSFPNLHEEIKASLGPTSLQKTIEKTKKLAKKAFPYVASLTFNIGTDLLLSYLLQGTVDPLTTKKVIWYIISPLLYKAAGKTASSLIQLAPFPVPKFLRVPTQLFLKYTTPATAATATQIVLTTGGALIEAAWNRSLTPLAELITLTPWISAAQCITAPILTGGIHSLFSDAKKLAGYDDEEAHAWYSRILWTAGELGVNFAAIASSQYIWSCLVHQTEISCSSDEKNIRYIKYLNGEGAKRDPGESDQVFHERIHKTVAGHLEHCLSEDPKSMTGAAKELYETSKNTGASIASVAHEKASELMSHAGIPLYLPLPEIVDTGCSITKALEIADTLRNLNPKISRLFLEKQVIFELDAQYGVVGEQAKKLAQEALGMIQKP